MIDYFTSTRAKTLTSVRAAVLSGLVDVARAANQEGQGVWPDVRTLWDHMHMRLWTLIEHDLVSAKVCGCRCSLGLSLEEGVLLPLATSAYLDTVTVGGDGIGGRGVVVCRGKH